MGGVEKNAVPPTDVLPKVVLESHITSTNVVVDVLQTDYNDCFRSYSVRQRNPFGRNSLIILRILSVNEIMLLVLLIFSAVLSLPRFIVPLRGVNDVSFALGDIGSSDSPVVPLLMGNWSPTLSSPRLILVVLCCVVSAWRIAVGLRRAHTEEVMAIRGLGMQLTSYNVFGWILSQRFVELKLIRSLIIHDAFFRCQVIFFLSATVENEAARLVLFEDTLPRLAVLRLVLCGLRHILYEEPEEGTTLAELEWMTSSRLDDTVECDFKGTDDDSDVTEHVNGDSFAVTSLQLRLGNSEETHLLDSIDTV
ncbi:phosphatidylinositol glycan, class H [Trypanosoma rangeli]|uniref:Phosphatidylinositol glycan, class H n=1 Tax=Trypanosoma rangeli TaxID=5698 RepID=A0A422NTR4_TRYRA|nr:phosphatidylinositol glycan, class H [Trypanosoma rangeli]RNF08848.1 phosphatidylinositol glycan, class H [Trypanosoma rangeli]|eukprot:RNF08848.1 phosphatidylinositol glycan, class H [Trypanosoma rangeli]